MAVTDYGNMLFDDVKNVAVAKSPAFQRTFQKLQMELNRFAAGFNRPLIVVDGIIGPNTIALALATAQYVTQVLPGQGGASGASAAFLASDQTAFALGTYSEGLIAEASQVADTESRPYDINPVAPGDVGGRPAVSDRVAQLPAEPPDPAGDQWMWWVGGAAIAAGSLLSAYVLWKLRKPPRTARA